MTPFLKLVANDLVNRFGTDLSEVAIVFPNRRAGLFFDNYLAEAVSDKPIWAPHYLSVADLFEMLSPLRVADPIETICLLHSLYVEATSADGVVPMSLDAFFGWGERILADFEDIDRNMVNPKDLFQSAEETAALEASPSDLLDKGQLEALQTLFRGFSAKGNSVVKERFLALWKKMPKLYEELNESLKGNGLAYEGAIYRDVATRFNEEIPDSINNLPRVYAFVGLNALSKSEETLLEVLKQQGRALFYWDYDACFVGEETLAEAGLFIRQNLERFPNALPEQLFTEFGQDLKLEFVAARTETAEAMAVGNWLENLEGINQQAERTAVVLCNEGLLSSVLHAIPKQVKDVNITMGFPLSHTKAFALIEEMANTLEDASPIIALEQLKEAIETTAQANGATEKRDELELELEAEACYRIYTTISRFKTLIESERLTITTSMLLRLMRQVMRQTTIPFHGEPAIGLQIMGMLETRCLNFDNVLLLSASEGFLPRKRSENSFIPYSLRKEFGLPTVGADAAIYAYYFYRLIGRAKNVRIIYNASTEGSSKGEMSRFMTQLLVESNLPIKHYALYDKSGESIMPIKSIAKPKNLPEILHSLSPSAINSYLRCQLQFYFQRVAFLKEPTPSQDVIEPRTFGTIFHHVAEAIYKERIEQHKGLVTAEALEHLLDNSGEIKLLSYIRKAFAENEIDYNSIVEQVVKSYIKQLLSHDKELASFEVKGIEMNTELHLSVPYKGKHVDITLKGNIDRLDLVNIDNVTTLRVVDYKTGGKPEKPKNLEQLFIPSKEHPHYVLQTFLYALTLAKETTYPIAPALFFVHKSADKDYSPYIQIGENRDKQPIYKFQDLAEEFEERLIKLLEEMLCPDTEFKATEHTDFCKTCPYTRLCQRY